MGNMARLFSKRVRHFVAHTYREHARQNSSACFFAGFNNCPFGDIADSRPEMAFQSQHLSVLPVDARLAFKSAEPTWGSWQNINVNL